MIRRKLRFLTIAGLCLVVTGVAFASPASASIMDAHLTCGPAPGWPAQVSGPTMTFGSEDYAPYVWVVWYYYDTAQGRWISVLANTWQQSTYYQPASFAWGTPGYWVAAAVFFWNAQTGWTLGYWADDPTTHSQMCAAGFF